MKTIQKINKVITGFLIAMFCYLDNANDVSIFISRNNSTKNLFMTKFEQYHKENPHIYKAFKHYALGMAKQKGFKNYSSKSLFEVIRWHTTN